MWRSLLPVLLIISSTLGAQTLPVVILSPSETAEAKAAWSALEAAKARWEEVRGRAAARHAVGWACGWEFDTAFRAMVPAACPAQRYSSPGFILTQDTVPTLGIHTALELPR